MVVGVLPVQADTGSDLIVSVAVSDLTVQANEEVILQIIVQNTGVWPTLGGTSNPSYTAGLYLVTDESESDELLTTESQQIPIAGISTTLSFLFTAPDSPGSYYMYAIVDKDNIISETNEQNNHSNLITLEVIERPQLPGELPDLRVTETSVAGGPTMVIGNRMIIQATIENIGQVSTQTISDDEVSGRFDAAVLSYFLDDVTGQMQLTGRYDLWFDWIRDFNDAMGLAYRLQEEPNNLDKFEEDPLSRYLFSRFSPATRALLADYIEDMEPSETLKNALEQEFNSLIGGGESLYDLEGDPGRFSQVELPLSVRDLLAKNIQGEPLVQLNRILLEIGYAEELNSHLHGPLSDGALLENVGMSFPVPELPGTYYFVVVADQGNLVLESQESNNWGDMYKIEVVQPLPDLHIASSTVIGSQNGDVTVAVEVENIGYASTTGSSRLSLYLFADAVLGPQQDGDVVAEQELATPLIVEGTWLTNLSFTIANYDPAQRYYVVAFVETADEADETNNWGETRIIELPDLQFIELEILDIGDVGQVMARVQNVSQADADAGFAVELFLVSEPGEDPSGLSPLDSVSVVALPAGESKTLIMTFAFLETSDSGYLMAVIDRAETIDESDELNNTEATAFGISDDGMTIRRMTVKADKDRTIPWDSFTVTGTIDGTLEELAASGVITVTVSTMQTVIYSETIDVAGNLITSDDVGTGSWQSSGGFGINWSNFSGLMGVGGTINGVVSSKSGPSGVNFRYKSTRPSGITFLSFNLKESWEKRTGAFRIEARKIDLSGLVSPAVLEIVFGSFVGRATVQEPLLRGGSPVSLLFLSGIADAVRLDRIAVNKKRDSLLVKGGIAVQNLSIDLGDAEVVFTWDGRSFTVPAGRFARTGRPEAHKFVCRNYNVAEGGAISATIDLGRGMFKVSVKKTTEAITPPTGGQEFGIAFAGFVGTAEVK